MSKGSSSVYLAMWFGVDGSEVYRGTVRKAVEAAGYSLMVVDQVDHNGFIMDKVINLINESVFLIADISTEAEETNGAYVGKGVRSGVYWEAGFASGQKKPVILTCHAGESYEKRIHFDLQQYNQIRWKVEDGEIKTIDGRDFQDVLTQRILATVGRGTRLADF